jgi:hypothetical protein
MGIVKGIRYGGVVPLNLLCLGYKVISGSTELYIWGDRPLELVYTLPYELNPPGGSELQCSMPDPNSPDDWHIIAIRNRGLFTNDQSTPSLFDVRFITPSGATTLGLSDFSLATPAGAVPALNTATPRGLTTYLNFSRRTGVGTYDNGQIVDGTVSFGGPDSASLLGVLPSIYAGSEVDLSSLINGDRTSALVQVDSEIRLYTGASYIVVTLPEPLFQMVTRASLFNGKLYRVPATAFASIRNNGSIIINRYNAAISAIALEGDQLTEVIAGASSVPGDITTWDVYPYPAP